MKKIGLTGIYFPGALEALHENVPEGFELVEGIEPEDFPKLAECDYLITRLKVDESLVISKCSEIRTVYQYFPRMFWSNHK